jgi:predicted nucleotidyltransferase
MTMRADDLRVLCEKHGIDILFAFGSRAEEVSRRLAGEEPVAQRQTSDLDIGVLPLGGRAMPVREKAALAIELEELFGVARADLVLLTEADPFLAANIIRGELLYCADRRRADEYELYVLRRAGDLAPLERERLSLLEQK